MVMPDRETLRVCLAVFDDDSVFDNKASDMKFKFSRLPKYVQQPIEQLLHAVMMGSPLALVMALPTWWTCIISALVYGAYREWEQRPVERVWDLVLDMSFYGVGGFLAWLILDLSH